MLRIGGLEKTSLLDYPGKISAIIFTYGCNLRCPYCHNPELVIEEYDIRRSIKKTAIYDFLKSRVGKLDAVVVTGGEPLINSDLPVLIKKIKKLGFLVKLDTNGLLPDRLQAIINDGTIDYIAMDVKYPGLEYVKQSNRKDAEETIKRSIRIIMNSGIDYEFRTTYVKGIHTKESVEKIGELIKGAKRYYIQNFRDGKTIDPSLDSSNSFSDSELKDIKKVAKKYVKNTYIR
jgi:pyruvate formate lyase activating enzyme